MKITTVILAGVFALGSASVFAEGGAERTGVNRIV